MAIPHAEKLIETAQKGHKLCGKDRRHVVAYLLVNKPEARASDMAELLQVTTRQIYLDRKELRKARAASIREEDPALVLADISISFEQQIRDMEASKAKSKLGSAVYLAHCNSIFNTQIRKVEALQSLGYYPKNLGNLTTESFVWKADVTKDGTVNTRPVAMNFKKTNQKTVEVEYEEVEPDVPSTELMLPATLSVQETPGTEQISL